MTSMLVLGTIPKLLLSLAVLAVVVLVACGLYANWQLWQANRDSRDPE